MILKLEVPVIVQIGVVHLPMDTVLAMGPGSIIELDKNAEGELDLLVNNRKIGSGIALKVGESFGIQISNIGDVGERVAAMSR